MKIAAMPKVEVIVMPSGGFFGGVGEPTIGVAAPCRAERDLCCNGQANTPASTEGSKPAGLIDALPLASALMLTGRQRPAQATEEALTQSASQAAVCSGCHALDAGASVPSLQGLDALTIERQMLALRRSDGQTAMHRLINAYDDAQIRGIANVLAQTRWPRRTCSMKGLGRRHVLSVLAASALLPVGPLAKPKPRLVVVGGGFAGATLARFVKRLSPEISVVLIEARDHYVSCPMSNLVIAGQRSLAAQTFDYRGLGAAGVDVVRGMASRCGCDETTRHAARWHEHRL